MAQNLAALTGLSGYAETNNDGTISLPASVQFPTVNIGNSTAAQTIAWNLGNNQRIVLSANSTLTFTGITGNSVYILEIVQDATGSRTITWPTITWLPGGSAPVLKTAAAAVDYVEVFNDATTGTLYGRSLSQQSQTPVSAGNSGTALTLDLSKGNLQRVTLTGNVTFTFSNPTDGALYTLTLAQDATGSRTVTWPATVIWAGGSAPTLTTTASYIDEITFLYNAASTKYHDISISKNHAS